MLRSATHTVTATGNYQQTLANVKDRFSGSVAFSLYQKALPLSLSNCAFFFLFFASSSSFSPTTFHANVSFGDTPVEGGDSKKNKLGQTIESTRLAQWCRNGFSLSTSTTVCMCVCVCLPCLVRGICAVICTDRRIPPGSDKRTAQEEAAAKKHEHQNLPAQHNSLRGAQATEPLAYCSIQSAGVCAVCEARFTKEKRTHALGDVVKVMEKREGPEKRRNKYYAR